MAYQFVFLPPPSARSAEMAEAIRVDVPGVDVLLPVDRQEALAVLPRARAAFGDLDPELLAAAVKLEWLACPAAGPSPQFYFAELVASEVTVTNMRGIYSDHIAVQVMAYILAFARSLHHYLPQQLREEWRPEDSPTVIHLPDTTAVIVGVGGIGAAIAAHCAHFGMHVIGIDPRVELPPPGVRELYRPPELDAQLGRGDFVIMAAPQTPHTERLMDADRLSRMRESAILINVGRGISVVLDDLTEALYAGTIGGAALDVFEIEPLPEGHRLWRAPNFLMTPHSAARGPGVQQRRLDVLVENCRRLAQGEALLNVVDKENWF